MSYFHLTYLNKVEAQRIGWADNSTIRNNASCFKKSHEDDLDLDNGLQQIPPIFSWKNACIKTLRLRRLLKNGMYFEHKTIRDVAGKNIDIAAIDYNNGCVALATSKCKTILFYQSQNANLFYLPVLCAANILLFIYNSNRIGKRNCSRKCDHLVVG